MKEVIEQGKCTCYCGMLLNSKWENLSLEYNFATESFTVDPLKESYFGPLYGDIWRKKSVPGVVSEGYE